MSPELVFKSTGIRTDDNGKLFMKAMIDAAKTQENGWEDYLRLNLVTQRVEQKSPYYQRIGEVIIACGIYKGAVDTPRISQPISLRRMAIA